MSLEFKDVAETIVTFVREHRSWAAPIVFVLAFGESIAFISLILPFWGMLVGLGALIGSGWTPEFFTILTAAAVGAALGDWVSYWLGVHYHEQIAKMWPLSKYPDLLPKGRSFFDRFGAWAIVIARFSGPLRAAVPIVAGAVRMPQAKFQFANWTSAFLWATVLLVFGDNVGQSVGWIARKFGFGG
jgi:membrane protein DedA with SNARE-associated domain